MSASPTRPASLARRATWALFDLVAPAACAGCGVGGVAWCGTCGRHLSALRHAGGPLAVPSGPLRAPVTWAAATYGGVVREALVAYKDGDRRDLASVLSPLLADAVAAALLDLLTAGHDVLPLVVPVPSTAAARRRRGDAPVGALTAAAVRHLPAGTARVVHALRVGRVADQAGLDRAARVRNIAGAMTVTRAAASLVPGRPCVIVDDIRTSGSTLGEAARALRAAGAGPLRAAVVANTPLSG